MLILTPKDQKPMKTETTRSRSATHRLVAAFSVALALACGGDGPTPPPADGGGGGTPQITTVVLDASLDTLESLASSIILKAAAVDALGDTLDASFEWASSDPAIASVSSTGRVVAVANGTTTVTATADDQSGSATIVVKQKVARVSLTATVQFIAPGDTVTFVIEALDARNNSVADASVSATSSDELVISVTSVGTAIGIANGRATIVASSNGVSETLDIWVGEDVSGSLAIVGAGVVDTVGTVMATPMTIIVTGGVISAIGPVGSVSIPAGAFVVDGTNRFAVPGLADLHTHVGFGLSPSNLLQYVAAGVTTILNLGHFNDAEFATVRQQVSAGTLLGPTIHSAGKVLDGPTSPNVGSAVFKIVSNRTEGIAAVQADQAAGHDFIKVYNDLDSLTYIAIAEEARRLGMPVVGHGVRRVGLDGLVADGMDAIAHGEEIFYTHFASTIDTSKIPSAVATIQIGNTWVMPNLSTFFRIAQQWGNTAAYSAMKSEPEFRYMHPIWIGSWDNIHAGSFGNRSGTLFPTFAFLQVLMRELDVASVPFLLSTDSPGIPGMYPGASIHLDMQLLQDSVGMSPARVLQAGTSNAGKFVGDRLNLPTPFGVIEVGARADIILVGSDPTVDVRVLRNHLGVVVKGRWMSRSTLNYMLEQQAQRFGN